MIYEFNADEVFKIAIEIEENGRLFYEKAQAKTNDQDVKKIFADLAGEEVQHKARFTALRDELPDKAAEGTVWDPDNEMDQYLQMMADMHVFRTSADVDEMLNKLGGAAEALNLAMHSLKRTRSSFSPRCRTWPRAARTGTRSGRWSGRSKATSESWPCSTGV